MFKKPTVFDKKSLANYYIPFIFYENLSFSSLHQLSYIDIPSKLLGFLVASVAYLNREQYNSTSPLGDH